MELSIFLNDNTELIIGIAISIAYVIFDIILGIKNKRLKKIMVENLDNGVGEFSRRDQLEYYKNKNILSFIRFLVLFLIINLYIIHKLPNFFSFFSIAVWAIIITFKDMILSFAWFFYILTQYRVGEDISLWESNNPLRGEIIYINILNVGLIGKDINGEHNWQFYRIPNAKFLTDIIKREEISLNEYKKEEISINYNKTVFQISLDEFITELSTHLNQLLPKRSIHNVGNYKTFVGHRYKLRFQAQEKAQDGVSVKISFIEKPKNIFNIEKSLFAFVENLKVINSKEESEEKMQL